MFSDNDSISNIITSTESICNVQLCEHVYTDFETGGSFCIKIFLPNYSKFLYKNKTDYNSISKTHFFISDKSKDIDKIWVIDTWTHNTHTDMLEIKFKGIITYLNKDMLSKLINEPIPTIGINPLVYTTTKSPFSGSLILYV